MALCLPKPDRDKILKALKDGDLSIPKLYNMTDAERNIIFSRYVGKELGAFLNANFEKAMLSNQKKAMADWVSKSTSYKDPIRREMLKRVDKVKNLLTPDEEKGFLKDLVEMKLKVGVSEEEAATILARKTAVDEAKAKISEEYANRSDFIETKDIPDEALAYGLALDDFQEYTGSLIREAKGLTFKERVKSPVKYLGRNVADAFGVARSLLSSWDLGLIGRQGWGVLLKGDVGGWVKTVADSFKAFGSSLKNSKAKTLFGERGDEAMRLIRASILAQPNSLNGKFNASKNRYGLDVIKSGEEAYPSDLPARVPLFGRVFKASQDAYEGASLLLRARLASQQIQYMESIGVDMMDEKNATALGSFVASLTGRGPLKAFAKSADTVNKIFFAPRFMKGLFNTVTGHLFNPDMTPEVRKIAGLATLKIAASLTALLATAKMMGAEVEFDPRSSNFGKIGIGGKWIDISGGLRGWITLGSRIVPTYHNGEWGMWSKSPTTGKFTKISDPEFGQQNALDVFTQFFTGKLAPGPAVVRDWMQGRTFSGEKPTVLDTAIGLITPISGQTLMEEMKKGNDGLLLTMLAETFGFGVTSIALYPSGDKWTQLKEKQGEDVFYQATKTVTERYNNRASKLRQSTRWDRMTNEEQNKELDKIRREETDRVLSRYGIK